MGVPWGTFAPAPASLWPEVCRSIAPPWASPRLHCELNSCGKGAIGTTDGPGRRHRDPGVAGRCAGAGAFARVDGGLGSPGSHRRRRGVRDRDDRPQGFHALADDVRQNVASSRAAPRVPSPPQSVTVVRAKRRKLGGTRRGQAALHRTPDTGHRTPGTYPCLRFAALLTYPPLREEGRLPRNTTR
jgi:hypothetical protein